ncbi:hypothetical protein BHM03_00039395 [Ensete ventricosum]|nr:hypothetical protein BHM03_00039395 [Ensete ventricosum]
MQNNSRSIHEQSITNIEAQNDKQLTIKEERDQVKEFKDNHPEKSKERDSMVLCKFTQEDMVSPDESSDEGWQEANSKGRSGQVRRNLGPKRPGVHKLTLSNSQTASSNNASFKRKSLSPAAKVTLRTSPTDPSYAGKTRKDGSLTSGEDANRSQIKTVDADTLSEQGTKASGSGRLASKFLSYKEVAISPPGTILRSTLEQAEEKETEDSKENPSLLEISEEQVKLTVATSYSETSSNDSEKEAHSSGIDTSNIIEKGDTATLQDLAPSKMATTNGSKLSASAPPFNPGSLLSMSHPYNSVAMRGSYDMRVSNQTTRQPLRILPQSVDSRVPCGPRSTLYYKSGHSFCKKHFYLNSQKALTSSGNPGTSIMNPHAAEFVPGKALEQQDHSDGSPEAQIPGTDQKEQLQTVMTATDENSVVLSEVSSEIKEVSDEGKSKISKGKDSIQTSQRTELARQILLSFIVRSVKDSLSTTVEAQGTLDSPTLTQTPTNEGNTSNVANTKYDHQANDHGLSKHEDKSKDTEGFTVVSKRRRNKQQLANAVDGLYTQQSICT